MAAQENGNSANEAAYVEHLVAQIQASLDLLVQQHQISRPDASLIKSKLPRPATEVVKPATERLGIPSAAFSNLSLNSQGTGTSNDHMRDLHANGEATPPEPQPPQPLVMPVPTPSGSSAGPVGMPPLPSRASQVSLAPPQKRARALWPYTGTASDDLTFQKDDVIIIIAEENDDWWRGSLRPDGPTGLFPSNHVQLIPGAGPEPAYPQSASSTSLHELQQQQQKTGSSAAHVAPYPPMQQGGWQQAGPSGYPGPPMGGYPAQQKPGMATGPEQMYGQQAQQQGQPQQVVVEQVKKPKKPFQGRMGQAFAGGVGFGAGSAIAGNIVNAIL